MRVRTHDTLEAAVGREHTALLVIDVQNDLCGYPAAARVVPAVARLVEVARAADVEVVWIQNTVYPGRSSSASELARRAKLGLPLEVTVDGTRGQRFAAPLEPHAGELVVRKHRLDSFQGTDLDMLLRCRGIETIVVTGVATHGCVLSTSYAGNSRDYYVVVAEDCVASWDAAVHDGALAALRATMNHVVPASSLEAVWRRAAASRPRAAATA